VADHIRRGMGMRRVSVRQSANSPAEQELWSWSIRYGSSLGWSHSGNSAHYCPSAHESRIRARGRRKGHADPGVASGGVCFARLMHRHGRVLGGYAVRAACGGNLSLVWLPRRVARYEAVSLLAHLRHAATRSSTVGKAAWASIVMDPNGHGEDGDTLWKSLRTARCSIRARACGSETS
jgi:hypothetical protein